MLPRMINAKQIVTFTYTNYNGKTAKRRVLPERIWFGVSAWHEGAQWFLSGLDVEKGQFRDFAMQKIVDWKPYENDLDPP